MASQRALCLSLLIVSFVIQGPSAQARDLATELDKVAAHAQASMNAAGLSVAVQVGDRRAFTASYGEADLENHVAATPETVYRIASVTKMLTAAAVLKLVDTGKLRLRDPVTEHVPAFDRGPEEITLHQLLTHTSGLQNYSRAIGNRNRLPLSPDEVLSLFEEKKLDFPPGKGWKYSNSGYFLLGLAIETAAGMSYGDYVEQKLAGPLDLHQTVYCDTSRLIEHRARGYVHRKGRFQNAKQIEMHAPFAAGALCSTARDLAQWAHALFNGSVLSPMRVRQMTTSVEVRGNSRDYGYGVVVDELDGHRRFQHAGSISGFSAFLAYFPDSQLAVAVLTNTGGIDAGRIGDALARVVFDVGIDE